jgi:hypothetical protein
VEGEGEGRGKEEGEGGGGGGIAWHHDFSIVLLPHRHLRNSTRVPYSAYPHRIIALHTSKIFLCTAKMFLKQFYLKLLNESLVNRKHTSGRVAQNTLITNFAKYTFPFKRKFAHILYFRLFSAMVDCRQPQISTKSTFLLKYLSCPNHW